LVEAGETGLQMMARRPETQPDRGEIFMIRVTRVDLQKALFQHDHASLKTQKPQKRNADFEWNVKEDSVDTVGTYQIKKSDPARRLIL
jgi:hypothetical protein